MVISHQIMVVKQWSASTGTDAAPYFRIFNPITQSKNFDINGEFIKNIFLS